MNHLEDDRNTEEVTVQPRSAERTQQLRNLHNLSHLPQKHHKNPPHLLTQMTYSNTVLPLQKKPLTSHPYHLSNQKLAFLPSVRRPKRTIDFPLYEEVKKKYFPIIWKEYLNDNS